MYDYFRGYYRARVNGQLYKAKTIEELEAAIDKGEQGGCGCGGSNGVSVGDPLPEATDPELSSGTPD